MPMWPTRAEGIRRRIPSTMPSPALRTGTSASFFPATRAAVMCSSGVSISIGSVGRSLVTS